MFRRTMTAMQSFFIADERAVRQESESKGDIFTKYGKILAALVLALAMCLGLTACGGGNSDSDNNDNTDPIQTAPPVIEGAVYDSAAGASAYGEYYGVWEGASGAKCDTLEVSAADGGMYFTFYKAGEITASGSAQVIEEYGKLYFFNEHDGCAYLAQGSTTELAIESLGTYVISSSGTDGADEAFADIADVWYLDGEKDGLSCIVILSDGQWGLGERSEAGEDFSTVDRGQLEQDPNDADQYYAHSSDFEGVTYDMHTPAEKDTFWWGGENDTYLRQANSQ